MGEVDFIAAPPLTTSVSEVRVIQGRTVALDTPAEIVAKKLHYRAASFQPRDVFDLAAVLSHEPDALWISREAWADTLPVLRRRMRARWKRNTRRMRPHSASYRPQSRTAM